METVECWVCVDCAVWQANGDASGMDVETEGRVTSVDGHWFIGDEYDEFSHSRCDACHSPLYGSRHQAWFVIGSDQVSV